MVTEKTASRSSQTSEERIEPAGLYKEKPRLPKRRGHLTAT
jgi:hypothetical protein